MRVFTTCTATAVALIVTNVRAAPAHPLSGFDTRDIKGFDYGNTKIRGVNLGGWFVLEPWITPSIFDATPDNVVDEYTFGQTLGQSEGRARLEAHWSTFYTAEDFAQMKQYGINFVRIPIGYWSVTPLAGEPYITGAYEHLPDALQWADDNGIKVLLDLHGAPGSQNGFDNSGRRAGIGWTQGDSVTQTKTALNKLRDDHGAHPAVAGIELLNEPMGPSLDMDTVRQFYYDGWGNLRDTPVAVVFHDAFEGATSWNSFGAGMANLVVDTHHYEVFDAGSLQQSIRQHIATACSFGASLESNNKWTIAGEWTGAMTDCARWLNGRGVGARYDGSYDSGGQTSSYIGSCASKMTGTVDGLSAADRDNIRSFVSAQMAAFEKAAGWIFWTWKNEAAPEWHFQNLTRAGLVAQPLGDYGNICG